ncbi:murein L,D-transpeptidase [Nocardioides sp. BGMRC 2183]|nr:murein L,D-transpeptidase [Nocardioides sp. BGMRC 2183]
MSSRTHRTGRRVLLVVVLTATLSLLAYGAGWAYRTYDADPAAASDARGGSGTTDRVDADRSRGEGAKPSASAPEREGTPGGRARPDAPGDGVSPSDGSSSEDGSEDGDTQPSDRTSNATDEPTMVAGPALFAPGDESDGVREIQARLRQIDWFNADVTGYYGDVTTAAVSGFQAKRGFPVTGEVDRRTLVRLEEMSTEPTDAELANQLGGNTPGALDPRCSTGRVLCIDKSSNTLRWVVDGTVLTTVDVRFGSSATPTREGEFSVEWKSRDHVSSLYHTPMPYAMFFSGGQAVHYSSDFAANGYNGASHGCVNVRDEGAIATLFDQVQVGDRVIVYWS